MYEFNRNSVKVEHGEKSQALALTDNIACVFTCTNFVGGDSYELVIITKGENVSKLESTMMHEHAESYELPEPYFCNDCDRESCNPVCEQCESACDEQDQYEGCEGVAFRWQLSRCSYFIGGGANYAEVLAALIQLKAAYPLSGQLDDTTWIFKIWRLREVVDLSIGETVELLHLEEMVLEVYPHVEVIQYE
jgi:hypothetical protein